ncbi:unnamed protein product [Ceutorhynchus assimilis]|uniref:Uncharacterized protein n=1 Tax=Ceutorhynchus assimilis TaxID=467358 RepID=A0A9N9QT65_9CUCU|nr:unnamed protein product [Ceutorhynchus assimilis]
MSASMQHSRNRSRTPDDYSRRSLLSKVDRRHLQRLRVAIKRSGLGPEGPGLPLEREIEDYKQISLLVHVRRGPGPQPRVPIFSGNIKVNQDLCEDRTVFTHDRNKRRSRSRSRSRSYNDNRRSRSKDRYRRRSKERARDRSRSRSRRKSKSSDRSKRYRDRDYSPEKSRRSRSRSRSRRSRTKRPTQHKERSLTPLRPGEYRPGHPDLALRKRKKLSRSRSRSRSRSTTRSRSRSRSPKYSTSRERSTKHKSSTAPVPIMEYDYYGNYGPMPMNPMAPYRQVTPGCYPPMYAPPMMMQRMPMPGYPHPRMPMFRQRLPIYNSRKSTNVTITTQEVEKASEGIVEEVSEKPKGANSMEITSSNQQCESDAGASGNCASDAVRV